MTELWANIFLGCFLVGFTFTVVSFVFGLGHHGHVGGHHMHGPDVGGHHGGHVGGHGDGSHHLGDGDIPYFNFTTVLVFITFFGGVGYILNSRSNGFVLNTLLFAILAGFVASAAVFLFLSKILIRGETPMDPTDYHMPGTLARVTSLIREGGTGEIIYVQGGTRKTAGARSEDNTAHQQGEEVVIVRYEKGIAYVKSVGDELSAL
ncbi:MAG: hypothetical protein K1X53_09865 [Candidatus Sumerlaeaceae bacterium]|nr:hypothetical protein [Candidatus Sumerlaeaceae bacterium]